MRRLLINWLLSTVALIVVAHLVPGIEVSGLGAAMIAAVVIGLINATLGAVLKVLTFPLTLLTLGIFWWVINAMMLLLASALVPGFRVEGFGAAFVGAVCLTIVNLLFRWLLPNRPSRRDY